MNSTVYLAIIFCSCCSVTALSATAATLSDECILLIGGWTKGCDEPHWECVKNFTYLGTSGFDCTHIHIDSAATEGCWCSKDTTYKNQSERYRYCTKTVPRVQYYHPDVRKECDKTRIKVVDQYLVDTEYTSGCYLAQTHQIFMAGVGQQSNKWALFDLTNNTATSTDHKYGYNGNNTVSASFDGRCLTCGVRENNVKACYSYDPENSAITATAATLSPLIAAAATSSGKYYFVTGGLNLKTNHLSKEVTRVEHDVTWSVVVKRTLMLTARYRHAAAPLSANKIMVCGGINQTEFTKRNKQNYNKLREMPTKSCEIYDNAGDKWTTTGPLNIARRDFAMVTLKGKVYAIGGAIASSNDTPTVEVYDGKGKWAMVNKNLTNSRQAFVALVVGVEPRKLTTITAHTTAATIHKTTKSGTTNTGSKTTTTTTTATTSEPTVPTTTESGVSTSTIIIIVVVVVVVAIILIIAAIFCFFRMRKGDADDASTTTETTMGDENAKATSEKALLMGDETYYSSDPRETTTTEKPKLMGDNTYYTPSPMPSESDSAAGIKQKLKVTSPAAKSPGGEEAKPKSAPNERKSIAPPN